MGKVKKRRHDDESQTSKDSVHGVTPGGLRRTRRSLRQVGPEGPFEKRMKELRAREFSILNREFQDCIRNIQLPSTAPADPDHPDLSIVERLAASYRFKANEINRRFGGDPSGDVVAFGKNDTSQLGFENDNQNQDSWVPSLVPSLVRRESRMVDCGGMHSVVLARNGVPYTWGSNDFGNLGRPTKDEVEEMNAEYVTGFVTKTGIKEDMQISQVSAGESHTLYLSLNGNVYSSGMYKEKDKTPFKIIARPDERPKGRNEKPQHIWQMPGKAILIYSGGDFAAAILEDQSMVTWGFGTTGELGRSADMTNPNSKGEYDLGPNFYAKIGIDDAIIREKFMTPQPPRFNWGSPKKTVLTIGCGLYHMLVVAREPGVAETNVYATGNNGFGQLGLGDVKTRHELTLIRHLEGKDIAQVSAGEHFSMALCMLGEKLYTFGRSDKGSLGRGPPMVDKEGKELLEATPKTVTFPVNEPILIAKISAGDRHALAVTADNELYSWGFEGSTGHLVDADTFYPKKLDITEFMNQPSRAFDIAGGGQHCSAVIQRYG